MTRTIAAAHLLLTHGWASPGHVVVDDDGTIVEARPGGAERPQLTLRGFVVPGIANLHSHAHHRGLVGHADRMAPDVAATLWSWREVMYRHLLRLTPDDLEAYATLAYVEMLRRGYTSVGEFHYVHHDCDGSRYADPAECSGRIVAAAEAAGIALTLLPTFYAAGGFAGRRNSSSGGSRPGSTSTWRWWRGLTRSPPNARPCGSGSRRTAYARCQRRSWKSCSMSVRTVRFTSTPPSGPRRSTRFWPDSELDRSNGCWRTRAWMSAGA